MELARGPFQGVINIVRFNWHFYAIVFTGIILLLIIATYLDPSLGLSIYVFCALAAIPTIISLLASFYAYDLSGIYKLKWIDQQDTERLILNINAGFDETSSLLKDKFKSAELVVLDFYDPVKHTEISIKRARKAYPPFPGTRQAVATHLQLPDNSADLIFVILAAHEIRNEMERVAFFKELNRIIKPAGQIYITEHLRDLPNFLVYTIGFFHFYSKGSWLKTFKSAGLIVRKEIKLNPFISTFVLDTNGTAL